MSPDIVPDAQSPQPEHVSQDARLDSLRDTAVRDLAWLLFSPGLLRAQPPADLLADPFESASERADTIDWLVALDRDALALHSAIAAARVTRLGRYAECLLGWFLQHGPAARLVAANVALRRAGVTLGECDFLVETHSGRRRHWELAVKCYLQAGDGRARLADYVGPNLQDRFDLKLSHLLGHQLPLSGREEFATLGHRGPWEARMFVKGWLFYRAENLPDEAAARNAEPLAPELAPDHARGWWTTRGDWPRFASDHAMVWRRLSRLEWLAPRRYRDDEGQVPLVDAYTLAEQLEDGSGPAMVAAFARDASGACTERSRGFIVPDDWPRHAQAFARHHQR
ncbi:DUF1853 family protein [Paraburkholderia kururiensis]